MSTRKIKDAKDLSTNELIYFKGHAQATYMSDGRTVEEAIIASSESSSSSDSGDNRYFTDFTVEAVMNCAQSGTTISSNNVDALIEAARANKLICIPYANVDSGYVVASYSFIDGVEGGLKANFNILEGSVLYYFNIPWVGIETGYSVRGNHVVTLSPCIGGIDVENGVAYVTALDNSVYIIYDTVEELYVYPDSYWDIGTTIKFISGENLTIEVPNCFWANGVVPTIEPNTHYELSISNNLDYGCNAVLTPFKPVE